MRYFVSCAHCAPDAHQIVRLRADKTVVKLASTMLNNRWVRWANNSSLVALVSLIGACDGQNTGGAMACPLGDETCGCYANKTCNTDLVCRSNICVANGAGIGGSTNSTALGGATMVGNGGAFATGGSTNSTALGGATMVGNGGAFATGGSTTVGNGGALPTGGATTVGNGGAFATGGLSSTTLVATGGAAPMGGQAAVGGSTATTATNLIKDGTFQSFDVYWNAILQEGDSGTYTHPPTAAAVCVTNTSTLSSLYYELSFTLGYPNAASDTFAIQAGATYTLTYSVSATYPISFQVKIGHSVSPWTQVFSVTSDVLSTSYMTFSHQFTSTSGDSSAGLAFNAVLDLYGKICFQQVSLTKN